MIYEQMSLKMSTPEWASKHGAAPSFIANMNHVFQNQILENPLRD